METGQAKTIEIHMASKVLENIAELAAGMNAMAKAPASGEMTVSMIDTEGQDQSSNQNIQDEQPHDADGKKLGDDQKSRMIHDKNHAKFYEKLLIDGKKSEGESKEHKLLSILDEIAQINPQNTSHTQQALPLAAPAAQIEFDEDLLLEFEEEAEQEESEQDDGNQDNCFDDAEESEEGCEDNDDTSFTLKDTNPGYFKSITVKI